MNTYSCLRFIAKTKDIIFNFSPYIFTDSLNVFPSYGKGLDPNSLYFGIFNTTFFKQVKVHNRKYEIEKERNLFYNMLTHNNNGYFGKFPMQAIKK
jgi:hypothetical protein